MAPSSRPEDAPEDSFLRDPSELEGFLEDVRSDPAEGGAPEPDGGPVETPREVSVEVEQARLDAEAVAAEAAAAGAGAAEAEPATEPSDTQPAGAADVDPATEPSDTAPGAEPAETVPAAEAAEPVAAEPAAGAGPDPERFWASGFQPATGRDEADAGDEGGGLAAKLAKLGRLMRELGG